MPRKASNRPTACSGQRLSRLDSLPDAMLGEILLLVDFEERRRLALVCKRWRQLVDSPPLLRDISVFLEAINPLEDALVDSDSPILHDWYSHDPDQPIQHVLECFRWLRKHAAQHVQRLAIELGQLVVEQEYENQEVVIDVMRNALRACTQLQHLSLTLQSNFELHMAQDLAPSARAQMRSLSIVCRDIDFDDLEPGAALEVADLASLTGLESLELASMCATIGRSPRGGGGGGMQQPAAAQPGSDASLPPSLTSLTLEGYLDVRSSVRQFVPPQITALTNLRCLTLSNVQCSSGADFRHLTALSSMTALCLLGCAHLPACLPQLQQLRALQLWHSTQNMAIGVEAAHARLGSTLQQLAVAAAAGQQLTHLVLEGDMPQLPAQVAALPHLQALYWTSGSAASQLPASGPYLTSLRRLALASVVAAGNTGVLGAMPNLASLAVLRTTDSPPKDVAPELSIVRWAAQHQPARLRRLAVSFDLCNFSRTSWAWSKYGQWLQAELPRLRLPPWLWFELNNTLLRELRDV